MKSRAVIFFLFSALMSCTEGYITPIYVKPVVVNGAATLSNLSGEIGVLYINDQLVNTGIAPGTSGTVGLARNARYNLAVANDQTFNMKIRYNDRIHLDTILTVAKTGTDLFVSYKKTRADTSYMIYTLHTEKQSAPGKGMAKIRFVNALPQLPGDGSISINFSRRHDLPVNDNKPLKFRSESEYIEVPFGTYQPLVTDANGTPVISYVGDGSDFARTNLHWDQIQVQPGGVYSFIVSMDYNDGLERQGAPYFQSVRLLEEQLYPQEAMGKVKFVHVNPVVDEVTVYIDGKSITESPLRFGGELNPVGLSGGSHTVTVFDYSGRKIVTKEISILDTDRRVAFIVYEKDGTPGLELLDLSQVNPNLVFVNNGLALFNFAPDVPVASIVAAKRLNGKLNYSAFSTDTLALNIPYLRMPRLNGRNAAPPIGVGPFLINVEPQGIAVAGPIEIINFNTVVKPEDAMPSTFTERPLFEFPSFAKDRVVTPGVPGFAWNQSDGGYFIVMVTGLRYPTSPDKALAIRVVKYIE